MDLFDLIIDASQHQGIADASAAAGRANSNVADQAREMAALRQQVDLMALANQAIWELLRELHGVTDDDLLKRMEEIDLRDGNADGRMEQKPVTACPICGRRTNPSRLHCVFCGPIQGPEKHVFE